MLFIVRRLWFGGSVTEFLRFGFPMHFSAAAGLYRFLNLSACILFLQLEAERVHVPSGEDMGTSRQSPSSS